MIKIKSIKFYSSSIIDIYFDDEFSDYYYKITNLENIVLIGGFNTAEIAENKAIKYLCGDDLSLERDYRINQIIN